MSFGRESARMLLASAIADLSSVRQWMVEEQQVELERSLLVTESEQPATSISDVAPPPRRTLQLERSHMSINTSGELRIAWANAGLPDIGSFGTRVRIRGGWEGAGNEGRLIGEELIIGDTWWTPVIFDNAEDPDWHKTNGLEVV